MTEEFNIDSFETVDDMVPENTGTRGYTMVARIVKLGFYGTPKYKLESAAQRNEAVQEKMFLQALQPLEFQWDTNPESRIYQQQGNLSVTWANYRDRKGNYIQPNSPFGDIRNSYKEVGDVILKTNKDCEQFVGKIGRFMVSPKIYVPVTEKEIAEKGWDTDEVAKQTRYREIWTEKLIDVLPDDWTYNGPLPLPVRKRGYPAGEAAAARIDPAKEQAEAAKLIEALEGKHQKDWLTALVGAGFEDPYLSEAATEDGKKLATRMQRYGLTLSAEGTLVRG